MRPGSISKRSAGIRRLDNTTRRTLGIADQDALSARSAGARRMGGARLRPAPRRIAAAGFARRWRFAAGGRAFGIRRAAGRAAVSRHAAAAAHCRGKPGQCRLPPVAGERPWRPACSRARSRSPISSRRRNACRRRSSVRRKPSRASRKRRSSLRRLTGLDISQVQLPPTLAENMPASIDEAVGLARTDNPKVREAAGRCRCRPCAGR